VIRILPVKILITIYGSLESVVEISEKTELARDVVCKQYAHEIYERFCVNHADILNFIFSMVDAR
jgi:hypothetical protein